MQLSNIIKHVRREYMSGVERTKERVRSTGEVFTPSSLVMKYVNWLDETYPDAFKDITNTFADNSCGDAQFLGEILIRKLEKIAIDDIVTDDQFKDALSSIHGIDFQISNIDKARERLLCNREESIFKDIVEQNIVYGDGLDKRNYKFRPMSKTRHAKEETARRNTRKKLERARKEEEERKRKEQQDKELKKSGLDPNIGVKKQKIKKNKSLPVDLNSIAVG